MIIYEKRFGAFNLLSRVYGASWPRAAVLALPSTIAAVLLSVFLLHRDDEGPHLFLHPYTCTSQRVCAMLVPDLKLVSHYRGRRNGSGQCCQWLLIKIWPPLAVTIFSMIQAYGFCALCTTSLMLSSTSRLFQVKF